MALTVSVFKSKDSAKEVRTWAAKPSRKIAQQKRPIARHDGLVGLSMGAIGISPILPKR
jgi:hypothetical protein